MVNFVIVKVVEIIWFKGNLKLVTAKKWETNKFLLRMFLKCPPESKLNFQGKPSIGVNFLCCHDKDEHFKSLGWAFQSGVGRL